MAWVIDLWTDGSGTSRGNPGGWAFVLETVTPDGEPVRKEGSGWVLDSTNNRMEMTALLMGLRALRAPAFVIVHSDSEYLIKPFTEGWIHRWERKLWVKVKNADLWQELLTEYRRHIVSFEWVRGHDGVELNERCDKLAGAARREALASMSTT